MQYLFVGLCGIELVALWLVFGVVPLLGHVSGSFYRVWCRGVGSQEHAELNQRIQRQPPAVIRRSVKRVNTMRSCNGHGWLAVLRLPLYMFNHLLSRGSNVHPESVFATVCTNCGLPTFYVHRLWKSSRIGHDPSPLLQQCPHLQRWERPHKERILIAENDVTRAIHCSGCVAENPRVCWSPQYEDEKIMCHSDCGGTGAACTF